MPDESNEKESKQYGKYIVWPENLDVNLTSTNPAKENTAKLITATAIGKHFELSANKTNFILSEIGWLEKSLKGWVVTVQGKKQGGVQAEDPRTGIPYVRWPESILESNSLLETIGHVKGTGHSKANKGCAENEVGFREKFEAKHRSADGHFVRSKAEMPMSGNCQSRKMCIAIFISQRGKCILNIGAMRMMQNT